MECGGGRGCWQADQGEAACVASPKKYGWFEKSLRSGIVLTS